MSSVTRREFSAALLAGSGLAALGLPAAAAVERQPSGAPGPWPGFPQQPDELVRSTVGAAHRDLEKVKSLVEAHPALANATWDWGFGDWETALGAAAHTGRREIAEYLLSRGARPDLFAAAMLGHLDTVRAVIAATPGVQRTRGPHGIPLLAHAEAGGDSAAAVAEFLRGLGDAGAGPPAPPLSESEQAAYLGDYAYGPGPAERFTIKLDRGRLGFKHGEDALRVLHHLGEHRFHPAGVPAVHVVFTMESGRSIRAEIVDHDLLVRADRV